MSSVEIKFDCPECDEGLAIDRRAIGHQVACPFCKVPITVPDVPEPAEIPVEPIVFDQASSQIESVAPSLEELASSRPELDHVTPRSEPAHDAPSELVPMTGETKKGGLPAKRKPGEKPKAMAEGPPATGPANVMPPLPSRGGTPPPPGADAGRAHKGGAGPMPGANQAPNLGQEPSRPAPEGNGNAPEGYEQRVRRKRKRRNPDEHRLNPREHPKMVAFDEVVGEDSFRKHPGVGKMPWWKKLGVVGAILGILVALWLGYLKNKELKEASETLEPVILSEMEKEFESVKGRLGEFKDAPSVGEKMSFVRVPVTQIEGYPTLAERMNEFYRRNSLNAHHPSLTRASTTIVNAAGDVPSAEDDGAKFVRVIMSNRGVDSHIYFEKSAAGYALDWDSFVGYNPVSWTEFLVNPTGDSESEIFRLIVERKEHYTGRFQDSTRYQSYKVTDIASTMHAIAYVVRDSTAWEAIEAEFKKLKMRDDQRVLLIAPVVLDERGVDGSNLTYIEKVLRGSWLLP